MIGTESNPRVGDSRETHGEAAILAKEIQSHDGNLLESDPTVEYTYADGGNDSNHVRPTGIVYPDGLEMAYEYGTGISEKLNRVEKLDDGDDLEANYTYLGLGMTVKSSYTQPNIALDLWGGSGNNYQGLDRFNRDISHPWTSSKAWLQYLYDSDGNRLSRRDVIAVNLNKYFDEVYAYDKLNRLTDMQRGLWNNGVIAPGTLRFRQTWGLDAVGNWPTFDEDEDGSGGYDLQQTRTHDKVNQITGIGEGGGQAQWVTPGYDGAGNTVEFPGVDPTVGFRGYYDAWNRLVRVSTGEGEEELNIAKYVYDARGFRITRHSYNPTTGAYVKRYDDYFNANWQLLESRVGTDSNIPATDIYERYVWHANAGGYVDSLLARDRDTNGDGTLDERLYVMQDANFNVVAVCDAAGAVLERYCYSPYGRRTVLEPDYDVRASSSYDWCVGHQGLSHDDSTGLINNRTRVLHPLLGRFLWRDSIKYYDSANLYLYILSSPINMLDPVGLQTVSIDPITVKWNKHLNFAVEASGHMRIGFARAGGAIKCASSCTKPYTITVSRYWYQMDIGLQIRGTITYRLKAVAAPNVFGIGGQIIATDLDAIVKSISVPRQGHEVLFEHVLCWSNERAQEYNDAGISKLDQLAEEAQTFAQTYLDIVSILNATRQIPRQVRQVLRRVKQFHDGEIEIPPTLP